MTVGADDCDTHFNTWPTALIPFSQLLRVPVTTYKDVFSGDSVIADVMPTSADDDGPADDLGLQENDRILFAQEHAMDLGQQLIEVRGHR